MKVFLRTKVETLLHFLKTHNVEKNNVLSDSIKIANSNIEHNFFLDGPHIVVGPIHVNEAEPGDILKVDVIDIILESTMVLFQTVMEKVRFRENTH